MAQVFDPHTHRPEALHVPLVPQDGLFWQRQALLTHTKPDVGHSHPFASLLSQSIQSALLQVYSQFPFKHSSKVMLSGTGSVQSWPQAPQFVALVAGLVSQPSVSLSPLQSNHPASQVPEHAPLVHCGVGT